jgi:hypothetical protein
LLELARQTARYSICECKPSEYEVIDERYLLDSLLLIPELRPRTNDWIEVEFDEALETLSSGPTLTLDDVGVLAWLTTTVEVLDPTGENAILNGAYEGAVNAAYERAILFRGTLDQVEYFLLAALDHRVQP